MTNILINILLAAGVLLFLLIFISSIDYVLKHPLPRREMEGEPTEEPPQEKVEPVHERREFVQPRVETEAQARRRPGRPRKYTVH